MELLEERYYGLNRILLSTVGLWPYDNYKGRQFRFTLSLLIMISFIVPRLIKLFASKSDINLLLQILAFQLIFIVNSAKCITFYAVTKNIKEIRESIWNNWSALTNNREIEILYKHGNIGKLFTINVTIFIYSISLFYVCQNYISILLDIIIPLNVSRSYKLVSPAEYFIDQKKYFLIVSIHTTIGVLISVTSGIATESFAITNAVHAFGLFKVARFSELLKASFGKMYLAMFLAAVCSLSLSLVCLMRLCLQLSRIIMKEKEISESIICTLLIVLITVFLILANYAGQEFINCDTHFHQTICNTKWYNAPLKTQKLILFLLQKTTIPYKVDAGGMFTPCLEGLATAISMAISYFTLLASI